MNRLLLLAVLLFAVTAAHAQYVPLRLMPDEVRLTATPGSRVVTQTAAGVIAIDQAMTTLSFDGADWDVGNVTLMDLSSASGTPSSGDYIFYFNSANYYTASGTMRTGGVYTASVWSDYVQARTGGSLQLRDNGGTARLTVSSAGVLTAESGLEFNGTTDRAASSGDGAILWDGTMFLVNDSSGAGGTGYVVCAGLMANDEIAVDNLGAISLDRPSATNWFIDATAAHTVITATTTLGGGQHVVRIDASGGSLTINLPQASSSAGIDYILILTTDPSSNTITIDPYGTETINGLTTNTTALVSQYDTVHILCDGVEWFIIK